MTATEHGLASADNGGQEPPSLAKEGDDIKVQFAEDDEQRNGGRDVVKDGGDGAKEEDDRRWNGEYQAAGVVGQEKKDSPSKTDRKNLWGLDQSNDL